MTRSKPQFLEVADAAGPTRRIAYFAEPDAPGPGPAIIWLGGFKSDMSGSKASAVAEWAAAQGLRSVRFDYSGHGLSDGAFEDGTIGQWLGDSLAVLREVVRSPSILVGSSMGGWMTLLILRALSAGTAPGIQPVQGSVLLAPAWDMTEALFWQRFPEEVRAEIERTGVYNRPSAYDDGDYPITRTLIEEGRTHLIRDTPFDPGAPVRILHGCRDPDVPWQHSIALLHLLSSDDVELTLIKDGEHRLSRPHDLERLLRTLDVLCAEI